MTFALFCINLGLCVLLPLHRRLPHRVRRHVWHLLVRRNVTLANSRLVHEHVLAGVNTYPGGVCHLGTIQARLPANLPPRQQRGGRRMHEGLGVWTSG